MRCITLPSLLLALFATLGCAEPDSVALGGACKQEVECKDPADTCMTLGSESLCSMACSAEAICPEDYACARMEVKVTGEGGEGKANAQGYCVAQSRIGSHIATIKPAGKAKRKAKRKARKERRAEKK